LVILKSYNYKASYRLNHSVSNRFAPPFITDTPELLSIFTLLLPS